MLALAILTSIGFIFLLIFIARGVTQIQDEAFSLRIIESRTPALTRMMLFFTIIGKALPTILLCLALFLIPDAHRNIALYTTAGVIIITLLANSIKLAVRRERPINNRLVEEKDHSFPSAHAATAAVLYGTIAMNIHHILPEAVLPMALAAILLSFLIGFSRVYLGIHFFTDIVGGWLLGTAVAAWISFLQL